MSAHVAGHTLLFDREAGEMRAGTIALLSDGESRSEIVIGTQDGSKEERFVFARENSWVLVYRLIETIREMHEDCEIFGASEGGAA